MLNSIRSLTPAIALALIGLTTVLPAQAKQHYASIAIEGQSYKPIKDIMDLDNDAVMPPNVFDQYDSRLVAASMVARFQQKAQEAGTSGTPEFDYMKDTIIEMAFHANFLDHIMKYGFQNQHQIDFSDGTLDHEGRAAAENKMIRLQVEQTYKWGWQNNANEVRPKYSFLTFDNNNDGERALSSSTMYGDVYAVLKDDVKARSTFTQSDSLGLAEMSPQTPVHTFAFQSSTKLPKLFADTYGYWETQIWGHLDLGDVSYFLVNCPTRSAISDADLAKLKTVGAPIYSCKTVSDNSHWEKDQLLYQGDSSVQSRYSLPMQGSLTSDQLNN